ncbi:2,5-dichloro-2,5-cyclohexadiene-1,4-diol dehydrogenase [Marinibacterium anthonyi]|nr:2,5-dichloro-2,5-cyclohexadiene-1,4-diol dehydrogenase [Marinibacterium anthonyi]
MRFADKTIIVTGASSGIGRAAARLLAAEGANLVITARRADRLDALRADLADTPGDITALPGDIRSEDHAKALVDCAVRTFGGLDGAFNNAGTTGAAGPVPDMTAEGWAEVLDTNLTAAAYAAKYQVPALIARGGGSVVYTSSFVGHAIGLPGMGAYGAAKAGLVGLVRVLAAEHGAQGIRVNALMPGGTMTEMAGDDPAFHDWVRGLHALKRIAEPEEIAQGALFLLSNQASFVTGSALYADGGNSICKT